MESILYLSARETGLGIMALVIAGFAGAQLGRGDRTPLRRGRYIALTGFIFIGMIAIQLPMLWQMRFIQISYALAGFALFVAAGGMVLGGFLLGTIAKRRAMDGFGTAWPAWAGLVPIAGLVLWIKPTLERPGATLETSAPTSWLSGIAGVVIGTVLIAGATAFQIGMSSALADNPALIVGDDVFARNFARAAPLRWPTPLPQRLDDVTELIRVSGDEKTVVYTYKLSRTDGLSPTAIALNGLKRLPELCDSDMGTALAHGVNIERLYIGPKGNVFADYDILAGSCTPQGMTAAFARQVAISAAPSLPMRIEPGLEWSAVRADKDELHYGMTVSPALYDRIGQDGLQQKFYDTSCGGGERDLINEGVTLYFDVPRTGGHPERSFRFMWIDCVAWDRDHGKKQ